MMTCSVNGNDGIAPLVRVGAHEWRSEVTIHGPGTYSGGLVWREDGPPLPYRLTESHCFTMSGVLTIIFHEGDAALSAELRQALLDLAA